MTNDSNQDKLKKQYKDTLTQEKVFRNGDDSRLKTTMENGSKEQFDVLQTWISNNIRYLKLTVTYLGIFATDDLSKSMVSTLLNRLKKFEKEFTRISKPKTINHQGLPYNPSLAVHLRQNVIPLVGQIIPLKAEIEEYSKKFFNI